jgi:dihydrofolate reductase
MPNSHARAPRDEDGDPHNADQEIDVARLTYGMMVSLDGFVESAGGSIDWVEIDEEIHTLANEQARAAGLFLYGRRLYELMAGFWPTADEDPAAEPVIVEFARIWRDKPKLVCSRTLETVASDARLLRGDLVDEVRRLKAEPGGDIQVGGPTTAAPLLQAGLVDEIQLFVNPVVLGSGKPFLPPLEQPLNLRLVDERRLASGVVYLAYAVEPRTEGDA